MDCADLVVDCADLILLVVKPGLGFGGIFNQCLKAMYRTPLRSIIGSKKMPLYIDIERRSEKKIPQKTF